MTIKQTRKDLGNVINEYSDQISELEAKIDQLAYLDMKNDSVYASLSKIKGVESVFECEDCFIMVPVSNKVKAGKVTVENFYELFGEDLGKVTKDIQGEVFKTPNSVGVFAKIDGEEVAITVNQHNPISELCITISGINEEGLTFADTVKKKKPKMK